MRAAATNFAVRQRPSRRRGVGGEAVFFRLVGRCVVRRVV